MSQPMPTESDERAKGAWQMAAVALGWLLLAHYLLPISARLAPMALQKAISWSTFRALSQLLTMVLGLAFWATLVPGGLRRLLGRAPAGRSLLAVVLSSPLVWSLSVFIAVSVAMPTLMEELRTRGPGVSRQNAGAFGAELTGSSTLAMLLTGSLLGPVSEELAFRGALYLAVDGLLNHLIGPPLVVPELGPTTGQRLQAWLLRGWGATLVAALVFGLMHADTPGGVGIVRVVSTTCLGLAAGAARTLTGSLGAALLLHMLHNTASLAQTRGWFAGLGPSFYGVPAALLAAALLGAIGLAALVRPRQPAEA